MSIPHSNDMDYLFKCILSLKSEEECYAFFDDVCTIREIKDLAQRIDVARLLSEGKVYSEIVKLTGASSATISRVNKCLMYGEGYKNILERIKGEEQ